MDSRTERVFNDVSLDQLGEIRRFVRDTLGVDGYNPAAVDELIVAVNEATANIVRHGYQNEPGDIRVMIVCGDGWVKVTLQDDSPGFDPTSAPSPDTTLPLAERPFGGMGVQLMRTFCDELSYRRDARGANELIMLKRTNC